jgi:dUTP pyrophosphatase
MEKIKVAVKKLSHAKDLPLPEYMTAGASGLDLMAAIEDEVTIASGDFLLVPTGLAISLPEGYEAQVRPRSGLAAKHGVTVLNAPGTIDSDYRGEIKVILINHGEKNYKVRRGDRIAQLVISPVTRLEWVNFALLDSTDRGTGGFGHTGER